jgi:predicted transposase YbfD/YdcC
VLNRTELTDRCTFDARVYICSAALDIDRIANAARGHRGVESVHWELDVTFNDDQSRYRAGHGAKNMAVIQRF